MRILAAGFFLLMPLWTPGQVPNDNIEDRIVLSLNEAAVSNTIGSTVQWNCLNQPLTRTCIKYHNDQWFEFSVPDKKVYYINVSGQECRDIWGIQVVVLAGIPCEPKTYELITCYSDGNKDDIFISLENLEPGNPYLLNVDGYLHDRCTFQLEISDTPRGIPVGTQPAGQVFAEANLRDVLIHWQVPDSLANEMKSYELWKKIGNQSSLITTRSHEMNALGQSRLAYSQEDSLESDQATYMVIGQAAEKRILIGSESVRLDKEALADAPQNSISLSLDYPAGTPLTIRLWDADSEVLLFERDVNFDPERHGEVKLRILNFREQGISFYKVEVRDNKAGKGELFFFDK